MKAAKTIVEGTNNILHVAIDSGVKQVLCLSTDKVACPIDEIFPMILTVPPKKWRIIAGRLTLSSILLE